VVIAYSHCLYPHSRLDLLPDPSEALKGLPLSIYAAYNAAASAPRHGCTKKTHEAILADLVIWATNPNNTKIYWLSGMARTGKTTIAYSFSEILVEKHMLGATFFCSRTQDKCRNVDRIFPTIAYELARHFPSVCQALSDVLKRDPDAGTRRLEVQFRNLIMIPVKAAEKDLVSRSIVIIVDALDECADESKVSTMLSIISQNSPSLPIKFFITSRPEQRIQKKFNGTDFNASEKFHLHDVEESIVSEDIRIYARGSLRKIAADFDWLSEEWPPKDELDALVDRSAKLFIYAATVCEYVAR